MYINNTCNIKWFICKYTFGARLLYDEYTLWMSPSSIMELLNFLKSSYKASTSFTVTACTEFWVQTTLFKQNELIPTFKLNIYYIYCDITNSNITINILVEAEAIHISKDPVDQSLNMCYDELSNTHIMFQLQELLVLRNRVHTFLALRNSSPLIKSWSNSGFRSLKREEGTSSGHLNTNFNLSTSVLY